MTDRGSTRGKELPEGTYWEGSTWREGVGGYPGACTYSIRSIPVLASLTRDTPYIPPLSAPPSQYGASRVPSLSTSRYFGQSRHLGPAGPVGSGAGAPGGSYLEVMLHREGGHD